ncbi:hypothetical protein [Fibrella forsythiae]|uniref:Prevent-host-death protein n=1 Tax=Fibrella forsythiae TaxID=2817061 RepID=A0ABS3JI22_9BACT|nr:hypothetical protein [Fibrella forsythiae]MBO0948542.1 hypothetical protein [Fibrella forsythiae]
MKHTIPLELDELNSGLIQHLKEMFSNSRQKRLTIIVDDEVDETDYLLQSSANRKRLLRSMDNARQGNVVSPDLTAFRKTSPDA